MRREYQAWRFSAEFEAWFVAQLVRQKGRCFYCFVEIVADPSNYQIDHKQPIYKGGTNDPGNLCVACRECNQFKSYYKMFQKGKARRVARKQEYDERQDAIGRNMHTYMDGMLALALALDD